MKKPGKDYTTIFEIERDLITRALRISGGGQKIASFILGIKPSVLNEKIKKFELNKVFDLKT